MKRTLLTLSLIWAAAGMASAEGLPFKFGGGVGFLAYTNDQKQANGGQTYETQESLKFWGVNAFLDIGKYFTVYGGLWKGLGDDEVKINTNYAGNASATETNNLLEFEVGAYVKYPFELGETFTLAPKIGLSSISFLSGDIAGFTPSTSNDKQFYGPVSIIVGLDADWILNEAWIFRIPVDLGFALNSKLPDDVYGGYYDSSSVISAKISFLLAHQF